MGGAKLTRMRPALQGCDGIKTTPRVALTAVVRGLSGEQLARSGTVFVGLPPMSAGQLLICGFVNHVDEHFGGHQSAAESLTPSLAAPARIRSLLPTGRGIGSPGQGEIFSLACRFSSPSFD
jgi:hypothetical protein